MKFLLPGFFSGSLRIPTLYKLTSSDFGTSPPKMIPEMNATPEVSNIARNVKISRGIEAKN
jgi:hypothetical protein